MGNNLQLPQSTAKHSESSEEFLHFCNHTWDPQTISNYHQSHTITSCGKMGCEEFGTQLVALQRYSKECVGIPFRERRHSPHSVSISIKVSASLSVCLLWLGFHRGECRLAAAGCIGERFGVGQQRPQNHQGFSEGCTRLQGGRCVRAC